MNTTFIINNDGGAFEAIKGERYDHLHVPYLRPFNFQFGPNTNNIDISTQEAETQAVIEYDGPNTNSIDISTQEVETTRAVQVDETVENLATCLLHNNLFLEQFIASRKHRPHSVISQALQFLPHLPFITPVDVFQVTSAGGVYKDDSLGISITVPEGAVPDFTIFPIEIGTCLYGPFQFPEESTLISPILMLCPQIKISLKKPIIVTLPHLLIKATDSDIEYFNIRVVKANHEVFCDSFSEKYVLNDINLSESRISFDNQNSITFSLSHFCLVSVLGDLKRDAEKIGYCIYPLIHRDMNVISYRLCVTFCMKPFIKVRCVHVSVAF